MNFSCQRMALGALLFSALVLLSCSDELKSQFFPSSGKKPRVHEALIDKDHLKLSGDNLDKISSLKLVQNNQEIDLEIVDATTTTVLAKSTELIKVGLSTLGGLIVSSAHAEEMLTVSFSLADKSIKTKHFDDMGAQSGDVLQFTSKGWVPRNTSGLTYRGLWDPTTGQLPNSSTEISGNYYIASAAGTLSDESEELQTWKSGDRLIFDGHNWQRSAGNPGVLSIQGKVGAVSLKLNDLEDTRLGSANLEDGQVLTWNASTNAWVAKTGANGTTGTSAGNLVQLNNEAKLPAVDGSNLLNLNPTNLSTQVDLTKGGTGASTAEGARTNLGLGSAALLTAGTGALNAVQLNSSGQLPAVDGSLLNKVVRMLVYVPTLNSTSASGWGTSTLSLTQTVNTMGSAVSMASNVVTIAEAGTYVLFASNGGNENCSSSAMGITPQANKASAGYLSYTSALGDTCNGATLMVIDTFAVGDTIRWLVRTNAAVTFSTYYQRVVQVGLIKFL